MPLAAATQTPAVLLPPPTHSPLSLSFLCERINCSHQGSCEGFLGFGVKMTKILEHSVSKSAMGRPALKLSFLTLDCYGFHAQCLSRLSSPLHSQNAQKECCWDVIWLAESLHRLVRAVSFLGKQSPRQAPLFEHLGLAIQFSVFPGQRLIGYWVCHCLLNLFGGFSDTCATV